MIPQQKQSDIYRSGQFVESSMRIAKGQEAWIFDILRNKTYKDKVGSPLREYVMNAIDEHAKLNKSDVPVEITLPSTFSNEVRVRDFARGLTDEQVDQFFAQYGESDKRDSNELIGAFGIGCKSAFAYTDSFIIASYKDGVKTTFNMYIDETKVGKLARMTSNKTSEPNGIEIIIPVKSQDVSLFVQRGLALPKYFKTIPTIKGVDEVPDYTPQPAPLSGKDWKYYGHSSHAIIIQGQIGYEIDPYLMGTIDFSNDIPAAGRIAKWEDSLLRSGLEIEVPIGTVELTASREELEMSDFTIAAIRARLTQIRSEIIDLVSETFKSAKTLVEAKTAYYNFFQKGGSYGKTLHTSIGTVKWQGQEIKDNVIALSSDHRVMQYTKKYNGDIILTPHDKLQCSDDLNLYYDDTDRKLVMYRRRAKTLLDAGARQVTIIQTDNVKTLKADTGLDANKLAKYSKVTPTILASSRVAGNGVDPSKRVKHKVKVFELDWTKLRGVNRVKGSRSDFWKVAEIIPDKQVYVPIHRFEPETLFENSLYQMRLTLHYLAVLGIDVATTPIYGLKTGQPVGENMIRLDVWVNNQIATLSNLPAELAIIRDYRTGDLFQFRINETLLSDDSPAKEYCTQYKAAEKLMAGAGKYSTTEPITARMHLGNIAKLAVPQEGELLALSEALKTRYPLIGLVSHIQQAYHETSFVEYIKLIDEARDAKGVTASAVAA